MAFGGDGSKIRWDRKANGEIITGDGFERGGCFACHK